MNTLFVNWVKRKPLGWTAGVAAFRADHNPHSRRLRDGLLPCLVQSKHLHSYALFDYGQLCFSQMGSVSIQPPQTLPRWNGATPHKLPRSKKAFCTSGPSLTLLPCFRNISCVCDQRNTTTSCLLLALYRWGDPQGALSPYTTHT